MSYLSYIFIPIAAFIFANLDVGFFSFYQVLNATIISSLTFLLVLSILDYKRQSILFAAFCIIFLSVFSSLPIFALIAGYIGIPLLVFYVKEKVFFGTHLAPAIIILLISNLLFRLLLLPLDHEMSMNLIVAVLFFAILNTAFGIIIFLIAKRFRAKA